MSNSVKYHIQINRTRHEAAGLGGLLSQSSRHLGLGGKNHITKGEGVREGLRKSRASKYRPRSGNVAVKGERKAGCRYQRKGGYSRVSVG